MSAILGIALLVTFLVKSQGEEKEESSLASSAILDILAIILNLAVVGIVTWKHYLEQQEQRNTIYQFVRADEIEPVIHDNDISTSPNYSPTSPGQGGQANPAYNPENDNDQDGDEAQPRVPGRSGTTVETRNAGYHQGPGAPLAADDGSGNPSTTNQNYVPVTGISIGSSNHTGSTSYTGSTNPYTEPSLKNNSYISDDTAKKMGQAVNSKTKPQAGPEPYITFEKSNIAQTISLPIDAAQVEPELISDDSEIEDSYRPNETSPYAEILVQDSNPTTGTAEGAAKIRRHNTLEVNNNQLANNSYVTNEENERTKAYVFAKDPASTTNPNENRDIERQKSVVKNIAYRK